MSRNTCRNLENLPKRALMYLTLLLSIFTFSTSGAVIGVDLGSQYFKSTLVKPGFPLTIVENTASKRKTPTAIAFTEEQRVYGLDAVMQSSSNPENTFTYMRDLLGMEYNDENLSLLKKEFYNFNNLVKDDRGYIAFKVNLHDAGEEKSFIFTVEEILSMILAHAKQLAEIQSKGSVKDVYLTVPTSFTMSQRRMLNDAAELADLNCVGMVEENTAAALTYGIDRKDENETHTVLFVNLGSTDFEVTLANFSGVKYNYTDRLGKEKEGSLTEQVDILSQVSTQEISGRKFDFELMNMLAEHFNSMKSRQGKQDIREKPRVVNRLLKEIPKLKDTLSANKEKLVNIPEVADYENLKMTITRADFEDRIEKYIPYIESTINQVLESANVKVEELSGIEVIGGGLRVPKIKDTLTEVLNGQTLGSHINGDEAMTFGAAFLGANSSSSFRVRKMFMNKYLEEPIMMKISSVNIGPEDDHYVDKTTTLYEGGEHTKRKLAVQTIDDLKLEYYTDSLGVFHRAYLTGVQEILDSEEYKNNGTVPKVLIETSFSPKGYVELHSASAKVVQTYTKEVQKRVLVQNATSTENETTEDKTSETESTESDENTSSESNTENEEPYREVRDSDGNVEEINEPPKYETITEQIAKNRTHNFKVNITEEYIGLQPMTVEQKVNAIANIVDLEKRDKVILATMAAKNEFEALIYSSREWLSHDENQVYSTPEIIEELMQNLTTNEDWLYEEGYDEKLEVYQQRTKDLNSSITPLKYRKDEHEFREKYLNTTFEALKDFSKEMEKVLKRVPWVDENMVDRVNEYKNNVTEWLNEQVELQNGAALNEDPPLTSKDIVYKMGSLSKMVDYLATTPKPKDWDKKQMEKAAQNETATNTTTEATEAEVKVGDEGEENTGDDVGEATSETNDETTQEEKEDL